MNDQQRMEAALKIYDELAQVIEASLPIGQYLEHSWYEREILEMYVRLRGLFFGVRVLLREGLGEEALVLFRSLFEASLRLLQLEAEPSLRPALVLGWLNDSVNRKQKLLELAARRREIPDVDLKREHLQEERSSIQRRQQELGVAQLPAFLDPFAGAKRLDLEGPHWFYEVGHNLTHGARVAHLFRSRQIGEEHSVAFTLHRHPVLLGAVATVTVETMLPTQEAVCHIFGWIIPERLAELRARLDELGEPE